MLKRAFIFILIATSCSCVKLYAQKDSTLESLKEIPTKYITSIDKKVNQYTSRITNKTTKTLEKLSRWETKIKATLEKINPETATRLFGNGQLTFSSLLQKIKQGEAIELKYHQQYDKYRDDLTTNMKYLNKQKAYLDENVVKKIKDAKQKLKEFNEMADSTDAIQQFIKERKKQLISGAVR
jgi:histidinol dehydrogenase